ncbi:uncharacterized protein LOC117173400 [Belonocnema kinseyi]|uniref:uncharacterized protein LOC117173400 n=1 Tax=Belonocnema kinseyi TaxID=2817044 RepID=UPI00143D0BFD|nr:uncharacterized protein LOC117173400 [Belonocnema kinseyi]
MKVLWRGWYAVSVLLALVCALPLNQKEKAYLRTKLSSFESLDVGDIPEDTFDEIIEDYETLRPNPAPKNNRLVAKPLALEPDAEMLPVHYKGLKPPGVDHMEMIVVDADTLGSHHLGKTAYRASKIEEGGDISGKRKSTEGKETQFKRLKLGQIENSQKSKKGVRKRNERNWYAEEEKRNNRLEKEDKGREENYGEFLNDGARAVSDIVSSDANQNQARLDRRGFLNDSESSEEDATNRDKKRIY